MTTQDIANRLVELNRANDHTQAYAELYSPDIVSVEHWSGTPEEYVGFDAIKKKGEQWEESLVEMHETRASEPLVADSSFAVTFYMDCTFTKEGRQTMTELAVYHVKDGKIVREEFYA